MADEKHLAILKQGVETWNQWHEENWNIRPDLSEADLSGADLSGADLSEADLSGANLNGANLRGSDLHGADLIGANLREAILRGANLHGADLSRTDLRKADLRGVNFFNVNVFGAILHKAFFGSAIISDTDFSEAVSIETLQHISPSVIGTDTLRKSKGKLPESFLRGCGLSDYEIETAKLYNPDLTNDEITSILYRVYELRASRPLQISPLFISYSHGDSLFVDRLEEKLNANGIRFWRDVHDATSGRFEKQVDRAIRHHPTVLLILSEHSTGSDWVEWEVTKARELEKETDRDVLCPIALDDSWKTCNWPGRIMNQVMDYNILDFSAWESDDVFDGMFNRLHKGLELYYQK